MESWNRSARTRRQRSSGGPIDELPLWALSYGVWSLIVDLAAYEACRIAGIVQRLRLDPVNGVIEVTLADGTASVSASWMICRPTPQLVLVPGRAAVLSGVTAIGPEGDVLLVEPVFAVVSFDEENAA